MAFMSIFTKFLIITTVGTALLCIPIIFTHVKVAKKPKNIWKISGMILFAMAAFSLLVGFGAYSIEMMQVEEAVSKAMPEYVDAMRRKGEGYAMVPAKIAMVNLVPLIVSVFTFIRGVRTKENPEG